MKNHNETLLAINPGTRYFGVAVLSGSDLVDWGIRVLSGRWSEEKLSKVTDIISELIESHSPDYLVMKQPHPSRTSPQLNALCLRIEETAGEHGLPVHRHSLEEIKQFHSHGMSTTRAKLAESVTLKYPCLVRLYQREKHAYNPYHIRLFEAVILGQAISNVLSSKCRQ